MAFCKAKWFTLLGASAGLFGCVVDTSSLTSGLQGGAAGAAQSFAGETSSAGAGGDVSIAGASGGDSAGQAGAAGAPIGGGGAGAAGGPPECISDGKEICNGKDDDCNATIDDGCPSTVRFALYGERVQLGGSTGGNYFGEQCEPGEVLTGIKAGLGAWVDQLTGVCSSVTIAADTSHSPYSYGLALSAPRDLTPHPETTPSAATKLACPADRAVVGLRIAQQNDGDKQVVSRIWITCARLALDSTDKGYVIAVREPAEIGPLSGEIANDTAWFEKDIAPVPQVAVRLIGSSGSWIDRVGLGTGTASVGLR